MTPDMDKTTLAAFVDGELSPEQAAAVVMHLADHPQDQAYVDDLFAANELLAAAFDGPLHEPVPEAIRAAIMGDVGQGAPAVEGTATVLPFRPRRPLVAWAGAAVALAAAVAAVAVLMPAPGGPAGGLSVGPLAEGSELAQAVGTLASLVPDTLAGGQEVMILATMQTTDGRFCREVEVVDHAAGRLEIGIACSGPQGGWIVEVALQEALNPDDGGFVTASGPETSALSLFLDREGAGAALDPEAEAQAIAAGWQG